MENLQSIHPDEEPPVIEADDVDVDDEYDDEAGQTFDLAPDQIVSSQSEAYLP